MRVREPHHAPNTLSSGTETRNGEEKTNLEGGGIYRVVYLCVWLCKIVCACVCVCKRVCVCQRVFVCVSDSLCACV